MLYQIANHEALIKKKCYFILWVIFSGNGAKGWFPSKGTKEKGDYYLSKLANKKIGKEFATAVLIDIRHNQRVKIWTTEKGEESYVVHETNKSKQKGDFRTPSLLRMSVLVLNWTDEYKKLKAVGKQPFVNFFSNEVDLITGDTGIHVAIDNFLDILNSTYWSNRFVYANIRYKEDKKVVAKIGPDMQPVILDKNFYNLVNQ